MANEKRLIDAYKLEDLVRSNSARYHHVDDVIAAIAGQPTVDAVEVVHGRWVVEWDREHLFKKCYCSACNRGADKDVHDEFILSDYCPNCGAKMDGGNGDG